MRAVYYEQFKGPVSVRDVPDPSPTPDGVVIRVMASGLCLSDWHGWMGHDADITLPHVPGHELAGVIEAVGSEVKQWRPGDRVTLPFVCGCGRCPQCASGDLQKLFPLLGMCLPPRGIPSFVRKLQLQCKPFILFVGRQFVQRVGCSPLPSCRRTNQHKRRDPLGVP